MMNKSSQHTMGTKAASTTLLSAEALASSPLAAEPESFLPPAAPMHMPLQTLERPQGQRSLLHSLRHDARQR